MDVQSKNFGFNFRLSDIHSALGISQLKNYINLSIKEPKSQIVYNEMLKDLEFIRLPSGKGIYTFISFISNFDRI